ncbi:methyltransferase [Burkholderia stagnalis]|uniref:S-adenosyl-L-methionine-dependent methyltransferase n=1 Tax=Burkholderia stagnalis TaxID=1503054 RepID=A0A6L3MNC7_9BURK|nr:class I SAM-dependent methyltransferase [Burkholderia stagnalis]KAB0633380.1 class I SAM-dependent methyltransferase [Burkholderia stagnalis]KVO52184.1 methyltransferase [Burkholderia stagnalis]KVO77520.1 methyltransferase [Burkholderia stagnalis]KVW67843.1 methyltransferase [Burkholderia stagnalis]KVW73217.1 methyltransferase [Burkholderia stagnalis]
MPDKQSVAPESTALRVALWRAMHTEVDAPPYVLEDDIGLQLIAPDDDWRDRPDMHPQGTRGFRASVIGRARFIEDLVAERAEHGVAQYVLLGAGLDTFAQRRPGLASSLQVFEADQPGPQAWKRQRLISLGFGVPDWLHLVPVDFEASDSWFDKLVAAGFATDRPAVVASTGVTMYLSLDAIKATLRQIASLARGTTLAMTFLLPVELVEPEDRPVYQAVIDRAREAGTPFVSLFSPEQFVALAREAGFRDAHCVMPADLEQRYFNGRSDAFRPIDGEVFLVATV